VRIAGATRPTGLTVAPCRLFPSEQTCPVCPSGVADVDAVIAEGDVAITEAILLILGLGVTGSLPFHSLSCYIGMLTIPCSSGVAVAVIEHVFALKPSQRDSGCRFSLRSHPRIGTGPNFPTFGT
jgi:hypothetical protein